MTATYQDRQRRTCIVVDADNEDYSLVKLDTSLGLRISTMPVDQFEDAFTEIEGYPIHKSIEQYAEFARYCGASQDVVDKFNSILDDEEKKGVDVKLTRMKLQQVKLLDSKAAQKPSAKSADDTPPWDDEPSVDNSKPTKKGKTAMARQPKASVKVPSSSATSNTGSIKQPRRTAASAFKDLILTGQYSDDEIFATVQKEFGLDDSKRSYVAYYRRELKNKGLL
nr:MAG TPA: hypothetical protein [Caudoviricetes sp.]